MTLCMSRRVEDMHLQVSQLPSLAFCQCHINPWDPCLICLGPHNLSAVFCLQLLISPNMIPMVMCIEDEV